MSRLALNLCSTVGDVRPGFEPLQNNILSILSAGKVSLIFWIFNKQNTSDVSENLRFEALLFNGEDNALRHRVAPYQPVTDEQRGFKSEQVRTEQTNNMC
jgi:hypothetical protein